MEKLYDLHPIFEFFLTFYVGYLISNELRSTVIRALTTETRRIISKGDNHLYSFVEREKIIKDKIEDLSKQKSDLKGEHSFDEKKFDRDINSINERLKHLDIDIAKEFGLRINNNEYERDFTRTLAPLAALTFFSVLYSFSILILNGINYEPLRMSTTLFSFNVITVIFFLLMFIFSLMKDDSIFFKLVSIISKSIIATFFLFLLIGYLTWSFKIEFKNYCDILFCYKEEQFHSCTIFFSVTVLVLPIILNLLKFGVNRFQIGRRINKPKTFERYNEELSEIESILEGSEQLLIFARGKKEEIEGAKALTKERLEQLKVLNDELNNPATSQLRKEELLEEIYNIFNIRSDVINAPLELQNVLKEEKEKIKIKIHPSDIVTTIFLAIAIAISIYYFKHR